MSQYRIDYITEDGARGVWEYEREFSSIEEILGDHLAQTLKYAKTKMPEIKRLVVVELTEKEVSDTSK